MQNVSDQLEEVELSLQLLASPDRELASYGCGRVAVGPRALLKLTGKVIIDLEMWQLAKSIEMNAGPVSKSPDFRANGASSNLTPPLGKNSGSE